MGNMLADHAAICTNFLRRREQTEYPHRRYATHLQITVVTPLKGHSCETELCVLCL